jgi:hypothetical protein
MSKTISDLQEYIDDELALLVDKTKAEYGNLDDRTRIGTIAGFMLRNAIEIAAKHGAPRETIERSIAEYVTKAYES